MPNGNPTIADCLFDAGRSGFEKVADSRPVAEVREALARHAPSIPWASTQREVEKKIVEALHVDVGQLLIGTWLRSALLVKYLDSSRYPATETILAHLSEHTVKTTLKPSIGIYVGEMLVTSVPVEALLSLTVKGFILTIRDGQVLQMTTGTCQAKGRVTVAGVVLVEKAAKAIELPGVVRFGEGRRIMAAGT